MENEHHPTSAALGVEYATPAELARPRHHALPAILLCTPGLLCWTLLAGLLTRWLPQKAISFVDGQLLLPLLLVAVLTAIASIIVYVIRSRRQKPWFVILNLVINVSGLLLLLVALLLGPFIPVSH